MTRAHLSKLFAAAGIILFGLTANAWLASQGGNALLNIPLLHEDRAANAFLTLFVAGLLLIGTSSIGFLYAQRADGAWHARVSPVWLKGLNTASWEGRAYQIVILVLFVGIPIAAMIHLVDILREAQLCVLGTSMHTPVSAGWLRGIAGAGDRQIRLIMTVPPITTAPMEYRFFLAGSSLRLRLSSSFRLLPQRCFF
jgi:hypothetical protein